MFIPKSTSLSSHVSAYKWAVTFAGGQEEALAAYEEAYNDIFNLKLECHKHPQPHKSRKDGTIKWEMIEMWPMQVDHQQQCRCSCISHMPMMHASVNVCINHMHVAVLTKWHGVSVLLQDPIDASPAVLVKKYDITAQKDLELKLSIQQQELQR